MKKILCTLLTLGVITSTLATGVYADETSVPEKTYVIENEGALIGEYKDGNFTFNKMQASNGSYVSLENIDGANYVPFRYLLEEIAGFKDVTDKNNPLNSHEALYDKIKEIKSPSFIWENIDGIIHLYITDGENYYYGKVNEILNDKNHTELTTSNGTSCYIKNVENSCFIPLRALEIFDLDIIYSDDTELIIITKNVDDSNEAENIKKEINEKYKKLFNHNYYSYSSLYSEGNAKSKAYCVNKYGDYLIYIDSENFRIHTAIDNQYNSEKELKVTDVNNNEIKITTDMITFSGNKLYGISTDNAGDYSGKLFSVDIKVDNNGDFIGKNYTTYGNTEDNRSIIFTKEFKGVAPNSNNAKFLYTIDNKNNEQIKRVNISNSNTEEFITSLQNPVSDFSIHTMYLLYTDSKRIYLQRIFNNLDMTLDTAHIKETEISNLPDGDFIVRNIVSSSDPNANDLFYCVIEQNNESYIYVISKDLTCRKLSDTNVFGSTNLTILNEKVFVKIDGSFQEIR